MCPYFTLKEQGEEIDCDKWFCEEKNLNIKFYVGTCSVLLRFASAKIDSTEHTFWRTNSSPAQINNDWITGFEVKSDSSDVTLPKHFRVLNVTNFR